MSLAVVVNGRDRVFPEIEVNCDVSGLLAALDLRPDRVAVELNGTLCPRRSWGETVIQGGDRLEIVQFVGGGSSFYS